MFNRFSSIVLLIILTGCQPNKTDFLVLDFGSTATPKIAKRLKLLNASHRVSKPHLTADEIADINPKGIILSGGPASVYEPGSPKAPAEIYGMGIPVLGICYGMQLMSQQLGGSVSQCKAPEIATLPIHITDKCPLYPDNVNQLSVWMFHRDCVDRLPEGFKPLGYTKDTPIAMAFHPDKKLYAVQFHPERFDKSIEATVIIDRFVNHIVLNKTS